MSLTSLSVIFKESCSRHVIGQFSPEMPSDLIWHGSWVDITTCSNRKLGKIENDMELKWKLS